MIRQARQPPSEEHRASRRMDRTRFGTGLPPGEPAYCHPPDISSLMLSSKPASCRVQNGDASSDGGRSAALEQACSLARVCCSVSDRVVPQSIGVALGRGPRPTMEDCVSLRTLQPPRQHASSPYAYLGVFDGHSGGRTARAASDVLHAMVQRWLHHGSGATGDTRIPGGSGDAAVGLVPAVEPRGGCDNAHWSAVPSSCGSRGAHDVRGSHDVSGRIAISLYEAFGSFDRWLKRRARWQPSPISRCASRGTCGSRGAAAYALGPTLESEQGRSEVRTQPHELGTVDIGGAQECDSSAAAEEERTATEHKSDTDRGSIDGRREDAEGGAMVDEWADDWELEEGWPEEWRDGACERSIAEQGSTALVCVIAEGRLHISSVGDSRAVLRRGDSGEFIPLTHARVPAIPFYSLERSAAAYPQPTD